MVEQDQQEIQDQLVQQDLQDQMVHLEHLVVQVELVQKVI